MNQPLPDPDSPFAEFAQPKENALETFMQRKVRDHKSSVARWRFLGVGIVGAMLGAGVGVSIGVGLRTLLLAEGFGIVGALAGVLGGWLVGAMSWAIMQVRAVGAFSSQGALYSVAKSGPAALRAQKQLGTTHRNQWDKLALWLMAWGLIGAVAGAAVGAAEGAAQVEDGVEEVALGWGMGGSTVGALIAAGVWLATWRRCRQTAPPSSAENDVTTG
jgi:hypothetical protein